MFTRCGYADAGYKRPCGIGMPIAQYADQLGKCNIMFENISDLCTLAESLQCSLNGFHGSIVNELPPEVFLQSTTFE